MSITVRYILAAVCFLVFFAPKHAHAQWNQCDPLNTDYIFSYDGGIYYPTLDSFCPIKPDVSYPVECNTLGVAFVSYSDATILADGTIQAFSTGEDFSSFANNADVQISGTATMPNGQAFQYGGWGRHGYAVGHASLPLDETNTGDVTISAQHELNWPSCDGYGQIYLTSLTVRIGVTIEWLGLTGLYSPGLYNYTPLDHACPAKSVCGHNTDKQSNGQHAYSRELHFWMSIGGLPPPYGTGEAHCSSVSPVQWIDTFYPGPFCYDVGAP